jgi:hypothetical protein
MLKTETLILPRQAASAKATASQGLRRDKEGEIDGATLVRVQDIVYTIGSEHR